jgi:hypothetical protein
MRGLLKLKPSVNPTTTTVQISNLDQQGSVRPMLSYFVVLQLACTFKISPPAS